MKLKDEIKKLLDKDIIDQEEGIEKLAKKSGKTKTVLKKQLEQYKREKLKTDEGEKNFVVEEFEKKLGFAFDKKELARHILEMAPCFYDKSRNWWLWNHSEYSWERVDETDILNAVEQEANINTINSKEKNEMLEAIKQVSRKNQPAELQPSWIQFKDIVVDTKTGEKYKAGPQWFVTNPIPWKLHEDNHELTPTMDRIFAEWVGKENVKKLYEIIAYCLLPDYPIHRIFCFIGAGMNGKSCFLNLLRKFIGNKNVCSTELDTLLNSRFEVTRLHKKLVCQMGETNFNEMNKTSLLKKLSGGDLIGFEYKNKDPFEEKNYAKIIIATNNLPSTSDKTIGFYRRWLIVDFPNQFSEQTDILNEIPEEEYECLALKLLSILKELLEVRKFDNEGSIEDRMKKYEDKSNPLEKFLHEFTKEDCDGHIFKWEFVRKLNQWCKQNRFREISDVVIGRKMKELHIEQGKKEAFIDSQNRRLRAWLGIRWDPEVQDVPDVHPTST